METRFRTRKKMSSQAILTVTLFLLALTVIVTQVHSMSYSEKRHLRNVAKEMFDHAFRSYMEHAFPADELMPLSCKGRYRDGMEPNRGDLDDALGNFSLTLIDTLDSLVVLNKLDDFERSVRYVTNHVTFDNDVVVSVFEVNIRVLGGLISAHVLSNYVKDKFPSQMHWYRGQLLDMARDLGERLLPAFNTSTGIPHPRVNLKHGMESPKIASIRETCTACAGTMILEFGALSRLTGEAKFELVARRAMDYLWKSRNRASDLIGTILNIHNGDWIRRDAGVGAGVDSYYEYLLKAYILFGDDQFLKRFDRHYAGIKKYVSQGPLLIDVHMHRPTSTAKGFMDSLLAFWPGLQVLKGDVVSAVETHEFLYQVIQRHNYLMPEAVSITDFDVHWAMSLMRPEFVESTYFLYKSTHDHHYLEVGKKVMEAMNKFSRTKCGYAAVKDVRTGSQEDRMDSFVLAETLKYLYLLFEDDSNLILHLEDFIFTTEAHLLPLNLAVVQLAVNSSVALEKSKLLPDKDIPEKSLSACPSSQYLLKNSYSQFKSFQDVRASLKGFVELNSRRNQFQTSSCPSHVKQARSKRRRVSVIAAEFTASNPEHLEALRRMGITAILLADGKVQLIQSTNAAASPEDAEEGIEFMQEMVELSKEQALKAEAEIRSVQFTSPKTGVKMNLRAGAALFGPDINERGFGASAPMVIIEPESACSLPLAELSTRLLRDRIAIVKRGDCMFVQKARNVQSLGAVGLIVIDNNPESSAANANNFFSMSGDGTNDVTIPVLFLYGLEGSTLLDVLSESPDMIVHMMPGSVSSKGKFAPIQQSDDATIHSTEEQSGSFTPFTLDFSRMDPSLTSTIKDQRDRATKISSLMQDIDQMRVLISSSDIKQSGRGSMEQVVHRALEMFSEAVRDPLAYKGLVPLLSSAGFTEEVIKLKNLHSCPNPSASRQDWILFLTSPPS